MSEDVDFPTRFRGYDRTTVDQTVFELRSALDYVQAERDRAVAHALTVENGASGDSASATVQWLLDTAQQDAQRIRDEAHVAAAGQTERADELLRHRIELIEQAQYEADVCRAQASEEARLIVHDALEKATALLRGLRESEAVLQDMFAGGVMTHRMPPPRRSAEEPRQRPASVGEEGVSRADRPHDGASATTSVPYPAQQTVPQQGTVGAHVRQPAAQHEVPEPVQQSAGTQG